MPPLTFLNCTQNILSVSHPRLTPGPASKYSLTPSSPNHTRIQALHALQPLFRRLIHDIGIQILHDANDDAHALHKAIDSHTQHAVRSRRIFDLQDRLLGRIGWRGKAEATAHKGRELGVDREGGLRCLREVRGGKGYVEGAGSELEACVVECNAGHTGYRGSLLASSLLYLPW